MGSAQPRSPSESTETVCAPITGDPHHAPSTPGDLLFHIRAERPDICFEYERILLHTLAMRMGSVALLEEFGRS